MMKTHQAFSSLVYSAWSLLCVDAMTNTGTASTADLDRDCQPALQTLYRVNPVAQILGRKAQAIRVFPNIIKAGFVFGASYGEGELLKGGTVDGYSNSVGGSWGL